MNIAKVFLCNEDRSVILCSEKAKTGFYNGNINEDEQPIDAAKRIVHNLDLDMNAESRLKFYQKTSDNDQETYYFLLLVSNNVTPSKDFRIISSSADLAEQDISDEAREILAPFFDGFRTWLLLPDVPPEVEKQIYDDYRQQIIQQNQPIALAAVGYNAAGKSSSIAPLARTIGAIRVSSDIIRENVFRAGYNFAVQREYSNSLPPQSTDELVYELIDKRYNLFLDFKAGNNIKMLRKLKDSGYKVVLIHVDPPYDWIVEKVKNHKFSSKDLSFFGGTKSILASLKDTRPKDDNFIKQLLAEFAIWRRIDPSRADLPEQIEQMKRDLLVEINQI